MTGERDDVAGVAELNSLDLVLHAVNAGQQRPWSVTGRPAGGEQSGAWYVEDTRGRRGVLKISDPGWATQMLHAEAAVKSVWQAGYPAPAWIECGRTADGAGYQLQERVPGATLDAVDTRTATALIATITLQDGLDPVPERNWNDFVVDQLTRNMDRLGSAAASAGSAGIQLVELCRRLADDVDDRCWPRSDMVHSDFRPGNVLMMDGKVTGAVDVETIGSGTRAFDFATLLSFEQIDADAVELLVAAGVAAGGRQALRACTAMVFLDLVRFVAGRPGASSDQTARESGRLAGRAATIHALTSR